MTDSEIAKLCILTRTHLFNVDLINVLKKYTHFVHCFTSKIDENVDDYDAH